MNAAPFFIIGAQRSGTTLVRLMLNAHPDLAVPEEGTFWMPLLRATKKEPLSPISGATLSANLLYVRNNAQFRLWGLDPSQVESELTERQPVTIREVMSAYYDSYAAAEQKPRWGDKTPSFFRMVGTLAEIFPDARFMHVIRDGRDVFLSMQKQMPRLDNVALGALEWDTKVRTAAKALAKLAPGRRITVRHEDVLAEPEPQLRAICQKIGVQYSPKMLTFHEQSGRYIGGHHSDLIFHPIDAKAQGRWRAIMTQAQVTSFETFAARTLARYGYEVTSTPPQRWKAAISAAPGLIVAALRRAWDVQATAAELKRAAREGRGTYAAGGGGGHN